MSRLLSRVQVGPFPMPLDPDQRRALGGSLLLAAANGYSYHVVRTDASDTAPATLACTVFVPLPAEVAA